MPEGFRHQASHAAHLSAGVGIERPGGVGRIGGVRIDEVGRVALERAIDDMAGAFGEATFLVAGKARLRSPLFMPSNGLMRLWTRNAVRLRMGSATTVPCSEAGSTERRNSWMAKVVQYSLP